MDVEVEFPRVTGALHLRMSRSSPGRYALHEFAKNLYGLTAVGADGQPLALAQTAPHAWTISTNEDRVRVRYRVFGDRLDGTYLAIDTTHAHINVPAALVWAEGRELEPVSVRVQPPDAGAWRVATQLFATADRFVFTAPNLAYLADSPIEVSAHTQRSFVADLPGEAAGSIPPTIVLALHHTGSEADADVHADGLRRVVREQAAIFGEYPAYEQGTYTFIADYLPWAIADGMEHRNSAVLTGAETIAGANVRLLALAAHEFFHGWNVERIRPRSLEPFNLLDLNPSGELWLAEGFTNYYEALTMARAGFRPLDESLAELADPISRVMTSPAAVYRSAEEISHLASLEDGAAPRDRTVWDTRVLSHYTHGAALALGFDLTLREATGNERSLDDFMRSMWIRHGRSAHMRIGFVAAPYTLDDVRDRLADVSRNRALADVLIDRFVRGREVMDYPRLLGLAGLRLRPSAPSRASLGAISVDFADGRVRLSSPPPPGSPAARAGLAQDDALLRLGDQRVDNIGALTRALLAHRPGDRVVIEYEPRSGGAARSAAVELVPEPGYELVAIESAGGALRPRQEAFRRAWLGSKFVPAAERIPSPAARRE
jgi:predicted metalloprotease with PDZ domain